MTDTKNTVSDGLLPCPFCGEVPVSHRAKAGIVRIVCEDCGVDGPFVEGAPEDQRTWEDAIAAWNRRASIPGGVGVKGLEWSGNLGRGGGYIYEIAEPSMTPGWRVWVRPNMGMQQVIGGGIITAKAKDRGEAISVAEADYCFRILSALDLSPAEGEPVAWQRRVKYPTNGAVPQWEQCSGNEAKNQFERSPHHEYRSLYAAPSNPVISDEWQPIETAPKDGTVVLAVTVEAQKPKARVSWFEGGRWVRIWKPEKFVVSGPTGWWPTHWMPLPAAPAALSVKPQSGETE